MRQESEEAVTAPLASPYPRPLNQKLDAGFTDQAWNRKVIRLSVVGTLVLLLAVYLISVAFFSNPDAHFWVAFLLFGSFREKLSEMMGPPNLLRDKDDPEKIALVDELDAMTGRWIKLNIVTQGPKSLSTSPSRDDHTVTFSDGLWSQLSPKQRLALVYPNPRFKGRRSSREPW